MTSGTALLAIVEARTEIIEQQPGRANHRAGGYRAMAPSWRRLLIGMRVVCASNPARA